MYVKTTKSTILYEAESYKIRGACFEVYKTLGNGFLESVYQEALAKEFRLRKIPFREQKPLKISYKGEILEQTYKPDFVCEDKIIVELKAVSALSNEHEAQLIKYLKITGMRVGFLVNFGHFPQAEIKRMIL